ncbi:hypothetical protein ACWDR5_03785 [Streptomyces koyangensis]
MSHGDTCKKYPVPGARVDAFDLELAVMIRTGRIEAGGPAVLTPPPCKPRKLSEDELRARKAREKEMGEAFRKGKPAPPAQRPPLDSELERIIREGRAAQARTTPPVFEEME